MDYSKGGGQGAASCKSLIGLLQSPHFLYSYNIRVMLFRLLSITICLTPTYFNLVSSLISLVL